MHEKPSAPITLQKDLMKLGPWKNASLWGFLLLIDFSLAWFCLCDCHLGNRLA